MHHPHLSLKPTLHPFWVLSALLTSPAIAERFFTARTLSPSSPEASNALLVRVADEKESWVVRHAALRALAGDPLSKLAEPKIAELRKKLLED